MRNQNMLYAVIGALVIAVVALGIYVYREQTKPEGVELRIDENGVSVQQN
jgi:RsiW-degrading membrane proteinase PrsW (M82 family)